MNKRILSLAVLLIMFGFVTFGIFRVAKTADAQTSGVTTVSTTSAVSGLPPCLTLPYGLGVGSSGGYVVALQNFLNERGYMSYASTGYYGLITMRAVMSFQAASGISTTGYVGPLTRAQISAVSCGAVVPPVPGPVTIQSISPNAGPVGTTVTITGTGFTADNTIYIAGGAIQHVPATTIYTYGQLGFACSGYPNCTAPLQSLTFTVPSAIGQYCAPGMYCIMLARVMTPGTYDVVVGNDTYGKSNAVKFTVTGSGGTGEQLSIVGLDAPNQLSMTVPGTWTVRTSSAQSGALHYSVVWGDEAIRSTGTILAPTAMPVQGSASFTHAYYNAGTFTPTFTVTDDYGHSVTTNATVVVTPIY